MINKMYATMDNACKKASELTGVSVRFPKPSKRSLRISAVTNGLIGVGLHYSEFYRRINGQYY
ncbi:hypothetical protein AMS60_18140 [Bacillus sp. FJAT-21945]|nr:hypothetical protein AMS60_18140 [Bacillus sp. FJAT-21945]